MNLVTPPNSNGWNIPLKLVFGSGNRIIAKEFLEAQSNAHLMCFLRSRSNFLKKNDAV
jgi:hypothetical protein